MKIVDEIKTVIVPMYLRTSFVCVHVVGCTRILTKSSSNPTDMLILNKTCTSIRLVRVGCCDYTYYLRVYFILFCIVSVPVQYVLVVRVNYN